MFYNIYHSVAQLALYLKLVRYLRSIDVQSLTLLSENEQFGQKHVLIRWTTGPAS